VLTVPKERRGNLWLVNGLLGQVKLESIEIAENGTAAPVVIATDRSSGRPVADALRLKGNQPTMFAILHRAGSAGLRIEEWNTEAREALKRRPELYHLRSS
jgi:hypothetical protein